MAQFTVRYLENSLLDAMLGDPTLRGEFSSCLHFVASAQAEGGCGKCRKAGRKPASAYDNARDCILGLPQPARDRLKSLLNTQQLRLIGRNGREFTF